MYFGPSAVFNRDSEQNPTATFRNPRRHKCFSSCARMLFSFKIHFYIIKQNVEYKNMHYLRQKPAQDEHFHCLRMSSLFRNGRLFVGLRESPELWNKWKYLIYASYIIYCMNKRHFRSFSWHIFVCREALKILTFPTPGRTKLTAASNELLFQNKLWNRNICSIRYDMTQLRGKDGSSCAHSIICGTEKCCRAHHLSMQCHFSAPSHSTNTFSLYIYVHNQNES